MITLHTHDDLSALSDMKAAYLKSLVAPMDGMWDAGFTNTAPHWEIRLNDKLAGYYAANDKGQLLQFYVQPAFARHIRKILDHVLAQDVIQEIVVSTIDPTLLSLCLDVHKSIKVHTYLYELATEVAPEHEDADDLDFRLLEAEELEQTIAFQQACLGQNQDLTDWLRSYSGTLIERRELFLLAHDKDWIGLGECRNSISQRGVADLGMMVSPKHRRNGWATYILTRLIDTVKLEELRLICSTTVDNVAAQKAIERAGFISRHRIMNVSF